jgi:hypothetical protein
MFLIALTLGATIYAGITAVVYSLCRAAARPVSRVPVSVYEDRAYWMRNRGA